MQQNLIDLLKELDLYISSHAIYISNFEKALESKTPFEHKTCRECAFGQRFYSTVYAYIEEYGEEVGKLLKEIEKIHCDFHETLSKVDTCNHIDDCRENRQHAKNLSIQLFQKLLQLKRLVIGSL